MSPPLYSFSQQNNINMINGVNPSECFILQDHYAKHKRRLKRISQTRCITESNFPQNFQNMLSTKKQNHENWRKFQVNSCKQSIARNNEKIFDRMMEISIRRGPYRQKTEGSSNGDLGNSNRTHYLHHNIKLGNLNKSRTIEQQNIEIGHRILNKASELNHKRDLHQFRQTRQILQRINKFEQMQRVIKRSSKFRSKTLPTKQNNSRVLFNEEQLESPHKDPNQTVQSKSKSEVEIDSTPAEK